VQLSENVYVLQKRLDKIVQSVEWSSYQKNKALFELFTLILEEATAGQRINFTTLFSRLAFVGARFSLRSQTLHYCHLYRKANEQGIIRQDSEPKYVQLGQYVGSRLLFEIWKLPIPASQSQLSESLNESFKKESQKIVGFKAVVEALLFEIDLDNKFLWFFDEDEADVQKKALYDVHDKNELFNPNIDSLRKTFHLPLHINLIDVEIREDGTYIPKGIIVLPDHLVDVTSISECFKEYGTEPFLYLISKFKPSEATASLLIGNLVNFMLDEIISKPEITFQEILPLLFRSNPLGFALMDDSEVKDLLLNVRDHFKNLQFAVHHEFTKLHISRKNIFLEPSFYSRDYGIQGRLDLLHQKNDTQEYDIIELKSGKTFKPNAYGINSSHFIQTLMYDLMIHSAYQTKAKSFNYILYSKENVKPLRYAPSVKAQQYEALKLRNDLIAIEQKLRKADTDASILTYIKPENFPKVKGFNRKDIELFYHIYQTLNHTEQAYFNHFTAFIAREQAMAKTGEHGINKSNGHAALWLETDEEKKERFSLLSGLSIVDNHSADEEAYITFGRPANDFTLVNFRIGDIAVLYPMSENQLKPVLRHQIFKCTITGLTSDVVEVRLRNKQYNQRHFLQNKYWNIEQDSLDSSFNSMYRSLFAWAAAPSDYRLLYLGVVKPRTITHPIKPCWDEEVTVEQAAILEKILHTKDYFLLWGPPGTGKTSVMLKNLVRHLHEQSQENILLLAYTNRAVDEMCDAVLNIDKSYSGKFLRLGSRLGTDSKYSPFLLDQIIKNAKSRNEIVSLLAEKRIYISTVSSIINKTELFQIKEFDTVIIDEASQILEPMLAGLLCKFKRWILIGDHKQLPAVVVQNSGDCIIHDENLINKGFTSTRTSLFERLYTQIKKNKWEDSFGILSQQGRMHTELMEFANLHFYENNLSLLPSLKRQTNDLFFVRSSKSLSYLQKRRVYIDTPEDEDINWKTNKYEAKKCVEIIRDLVSLYQINSMNIDENSIGIITPYRAQIALINLEMDVLPPDIKSKITIDTVERYQGGARDIILISFCVNRLSQMEALISLSAEGIDRKLNVALTRAKEQIILIGNKSLLSSNDGYKKLIDHYDNS
jgi:DNA replication ATP-dependent helicase Dna2